MAAAVAPPVVGFATGTRVGSFRMFTEPVEYRLTIHRFAGDGFPTAVPPDTLAPHMSRDARRIVASAARFSRGETNALLLEGGLDDVASLVCELHGDARGVSVLLERRTLDGEPLPDARADVRCP